MPDPILPPIRHDLRDRLMQDIRRRGILVPILLAHDGECLDGRLRMEIAEELGFSPAAIPKIIIGRLSEAERADLRVTLNLFRRQLTQAQVRELIAWELRRDHHASDNVLGERLGVDHKTVGAARRRLEAVGEIPQLSGRTGSDGKRFPARKPIVYTTSNAQAIEAQRLLGELGDAAPAGSMNVKKLRRTVRARERAHHLGEVGRDAPALDEIVRIYNCDFRDIGGKVEAGSVDLALCDPPWGGEFSDLRRPFAEMIFRLLKPDGLVACYTGVAHLPEFLDAFRQAELWWTPKSRPQNPIS